MANPDQRQNHRHLDCDGKQAIYTLRVTVDPSTRGATYAIEQPHGVY